MFCKYDTPANVIVESDFFYVIPTMGQLSDGGHLLVIPHEHYSCLGAMDERLFDEFEPFVDKLKKAVTVAYGKPILFEHGVLGQSVPHAHLQLVPSCVDLFPSISREFKSFQQLISLRELRELHRTKGMYLLYQNLQDEMFSFTLDHFSQYLRRVTAEVMGKPEQGDWRAWRGRPDRAELDDILRSESVKRVREVLNINTQRL